MNEAFELEDDPCNLDRNAKFGLKNLGAVTMALKCYLILVKYLGADS